LICGTDSLRLASTRPSSHSLAIPLPPAVASFQKLRAAILLAFSAEPRMLVKRR
jgi:hypothetical protein